MGNDSTAIVNACKHKLSVVALFPFSFFQDILYRQESKQNFLGVFFSKMGDKRIFCLKISFDSPETMCKKPTGDLIAARTMKD